MIFNIFKLCNLYFGVVVSNIFWWIFFWKECKFDFMLKILCKLFYDEEFYSCFILCYLWNVFRIFGKKNGWNLKICKFVIFKLFFMEGVEIMLWLINCLKCVRKVEWVVLVGVDLERMVLLIMWVFGRDFCLLLVRVWGSLMFVEKM